MSDVRQDTSREQVTPTHDTGTLIYLLVREDQNDHGFVDTSVVGAYRAEAAAHARLEAEAAEAREAGIRVCGYLTPEWQDEADWEVSWMVTSTWLA
jgi:hypothetical protein